MKKTPRGLGSLTILGFHGTFRCFRTVFRFVYLLQVQISIFSLFWCDTFFFALQYQHVSLEIGPWLLWVLLAADLRSSVLVRYTVSLLPDSHPTQCLAPVLPPLRVDSGVCFSQDFRVKGLG